MSSQTMRMPLLQQMCADEGLLYHQLRLMSSELAATASRFI